MAWFLCSVSRSQPRNWILCKESGLWGYTRGIAHCDPQDHLLFWVGGRGYVGYGVVSGEPRKPNGKSEAPWPGGVYRFTSIIPFRLQVEVEEPVYLRFERQVQERTLFSTARFQQGFNAVSDGAAAAVAELLMVQHLKEAERVELGTSTKQ